jgi:hypothetical protein
LIFRRVEPNSNYWALRFLSESGRWELGLSSYQSGTRLRMGFAGKPPSVMDFCLGHNSRIYSPIMLAVITHLEPLPESASAHEIDALFPWSGTRPNLTVHLEPLLKNLPQKSAEGAKGNNKKGFF